MCQALYSVPDFSFLDVSLPTVLGGGYCYQVLLKEEAEDHITIGQ